jgi:chromosome segregation ATPase
VFKRSLLGYRRRDVDEALGARDLALRQVRENVAATEARLAKTQATLESRESDLRSQGEQVGALKRRLEDLEKVATLLAERVVERERELRAAGAEAAEDAPDGEDMPEQLPKTASGP